MCFYISGIDKLKISTKKYKSYLRIRLCTFMINFKVISQKMIKLWLFYIFGIEKFEIWKKNSKGYFIGGERGGPWIPKSTAKFFATQISRFLSSDHHIYRKLWHKSPNPQHFIPFSTVSTVGNPKSPSTPPYLISNLHF